VRLSFAASLGPISASIEGLGATVGLTLSREPEATFGFLAPTGIGLSCNAGGITGGGFVSHDEAQARYAGILDLKFGEIGLTAIAIITTKLPGKTDGGFALYININVTFSPYITLPYNFNLQGCGGLLALNRTMDVEALRSGLKNKTLNSILFPEDPIANA